MDWLRYPNPNPDEGKKFKDYTLYAHAAEHKNEWTIEAYVGNWVLVGSAQFAGVYEYPDEDDPYHQEVVALKGWDVFVHPDHRRKGLASAMYDYAREAFGLPIQPGDFQTPVGEAFLGARS